MAAGYDVVIIGSGAGGGASAWALSQAGFSVLVLEAGPVYQASQDFKLHTSDWEQRLFPYKQDQDKSYRFGEMQHLDPKWRRLRSWSHRFGYINSGKQRIGWRYEHVKGVGGSTLAFTGEAHRMNPGSMKLRSDYGQGADWPLTYQELAPFYQQAEALIGVAGPFPDPRLTSRERYPLPPHQMSYTSALVAKQTQSLGLHWSVNSLAALSRPYDGRPACNYCGQCTRGCPRGDKGSVDVTFLAKAVSSGKCDIKPECSVLRLLTSRDKRITAVVYRDKQGAEYRQNCRILIVACGAIETPRLLLNSASSGVANESGLVGKNLMETLSLEVTALYAKPLASYKGHPSDAICWDFNHADAIPGAVGGCRFSMTTAETNLTGPINYALRIVPGWGRPHKKAMREQFGRALSIGGIAESLPNPGSYLDLDPTARDAYAMPLARIHSQLTEMDLTRLEFMRVMILKMFDTLPVEKVLEQFSTYDFYHSTHVFGSCRMGADPDSAVVDSLCRAFHWKNLFLVDASVFPSSGGGESPSLTIEALAIRTAAYIRQLAIQKEL